jgi:hypothetical protein
MTEPEASQPQTDASRGVPPRQGPTTEEMLAASLGVRAEDIEPYIGLRYLSRLFKVMAVILILLIVAEVITGLVTQGTAAIPTLLAEVSRLIVLAGLLWGVGDFAILIIDVGHDVRAARILLGRMAAHPRETRHTGESRAVHI